jgi:hypothetical protein
MPLATPYVAEAMPMPVTEASKCFKQDFNTILTLLQNRIPFAFNRFSDGELFILQNKELVLDQNLVKIGSHVTEGPYAKEDFKRFHPDEHGFYQARLMDAFRFRKPRYFKGLSCRCCVGQEDFEWQREAHGTGDLEHLTWANLLINANYHRFIHEMLPLFNQYPTVFVCNEKADPTLFPFVMKTFKVGYNAMINDYGLIDTMKQWILSEGITGHLFLFSASSFSKMAIHQLYETCDSNTYMDVGTALNAFMGMKLDRAYLKELWLGEHNADSGKVCLW